MPNTPTTRQAVEQEWDELTERGRMANTKLLEGRWEIGWLALQLKTLYGQSIIADFAKEIGCKRSTVYAYRDVVRFWTDIDPIFQDVEYLKREYPMMRWGHYRVLAERYRGDPMPGAAIMMLNMADGDGETVDQLEAKLVREKTGESWHNAATGSALIRMVDGNRILLDLEDCDIEALRLAQKRGQSVKVKIMVAGVEVSA